MPHVSLDQHQEAQVSAAHSIAARQQVRRAQYSNTTKIESWDEYLERLERNKDEIEYLTQEKEANRATSASIMKLGMGILIISLVIHPFMVVGLVALIASAMSKASEIGKESQIERLKTENAKGPRQQKIPPEPDVSSYPSFSNPHISLYSNPSAASKAPTLGYQAPKVASSASAMHPFMIPLASQQHTQYLTAQEPAKQQVLANEISGQLFFTPQHGLLTVPPPYQFEPTTDANRHDPEARHARNRANRAQNDLDNEVFSSLLHKAYEKAEKGEACTWTHPSLLAINQLALQIHHEVDPSKPIATQYGTKLLADGTDFNLSTIYHALNDPKHKISEPARLEIMAAAGTLYKDKLTHRFNEHGLLSPRSSQSSLYSNSSMSSNSSIARRFAEFATFDPKDQKIKERFESEVPRKYKAITRRAANVFAETIAPTSDKVAASKVYSAYQEEVRKGVLERTLFATQQYCHVSGDHHTHQQAPNAAAALGLGGRNFLSFENERQRLDFMRYTMGGNYTDIGNRIYNIPTLHAITLKGQKKLYSLDTSLTNESGESIHVLKPIDGNSTTHYILGQKGKLYPFNVPKTAWLNDTVKSIKVSEDENTPYSLNTLTLKSMDQSRIEHKPTNLVLIGNQNFYLESTINKNNNRIFTLRKTGETNASYILGYHGDLYNLPAGQQVEDITIIKTRKGLRKIDCYATTDGVPLTKSSTELNEKKLLLNPNNSSRTNADKALAKKGQVAYRRLTSTHTVGTDGKEKKGFFAGLGKLLGHKAYDVGMNLALGGAGNESQHADYYHEAILQARQKLFGKDYGKSLGLTIEDISSQERLERVPIISEGSHGHLLIYSWGNYVLIGIEKSEFGKGEHDIFGAVGERSALLEEAKFGSFHKDPEISTWVHTPRGLGNPRANMDDMRINFLTRMSDQYFGRPLSKNGQLTKDEVQEQLLKPIGQSIGTSPTALLAEAKEDARRMNNDAELGISKHETECRTAISGLPNRGQKYYNGKLAEIYKHYNPESEESTELADQQLQALVQAIETYKNKGFPKEPSKPHFRAQRTTYETNIAWNKYKQLTEFSGVQPNFVDELNFKYWFKNELSPQQRKEHSQDYRTLCHQMSKYQELEKSFEYIQSEQSKIDSIKATPTPRDTEERIQYFSSIAQVQNTLAMRQSQCLKEYTQLPLPIPPTFDQFSVLDHQQHISTLRNHLVSTIKGLPQPVVQDHEVPSPSIAQAEARQKPSASKDTTKLVKEPSSDSHLDRLGRADRDPAIPLR